MPPKPQLIIEYKHFFNIEPPENRLDLIKHIPKQFLLYEIAGLNYRLKPYNQLKYDLSLETQVYELAYFCPLDKNLYEHYVQVAETYTVDSKNYPLIFNRPANLFALEEILNNEGFREEEGFVSRKVEVWDGIFKYLLSVNTEIVKVELLPEEKLTIENVSASLIALNELMIECNPMFTPYRGICLFEYLYNHSLYGDELRNYFEKTLKIDKDKFIYNLLSLSMANKQEERFSEFIYCTSKADKFLDYLSATQYKNKDYFKLLTIKKTPFYKDGDTKYVVLDIDFLINKSYEFFVYDFWFDYLKPQRDKKGKEKFNFKHYRSVFGLFFEKYVTEIIEHSFKHLKYPKPLLFEDLKVKVSSGTIEIADIYVRQNKKILVGQVKSGSIYDDEKYSGDINVLYRGDREQFFKDFGVNQTYESIRLILENYEKFDIKLFTCKRLEFYPMIVMDDKVFQTPLLSNLLSIRFEELLNQNNYEPHKIHPLTVVHISDLERIETTLATKDIAIWDMLKSHHKKIKNSFLPPFVETSNKFIDPKMIPDRLLTKMTEIIEKFSEY